MAVRQRPVVLASALVLALSALSCTSKQPETPGTASPAAMTPRQRGEYLSNIMGCNDCHTPGGIYGAPDFERRLSGSELGWQGPWGVSYATNLTPVCVPGISVLASPRSVCGSGTPTCARSAHCVKARR